MNEQEKEQNNACGASCGDCCGGCEGGDAGCAGCGGEETLPVQALDTPCGRVLIPSYYQRIASAPEDPKASAAFAAKSEEALCYFLIYPCPAAEEMPYEHPEEVIQGIHAILEDNQGLVEVNAGSTTEGHPIVYSIVRTEGDKETDVSYTLTINLRLSGGPVCIQGFFDPYGENCMRQAQTLEYARQKGYVGENLENWAKDPYDPDFTKGALTNFSELPGFDQAFPQHPLSLCRELVGIVAAAN